MLANELKLKLEAATKALNALVATVGGLESQLKDVPNLTQAAQTKHDLIVKELATKEANLRFGFDSRIKKAEELEAASIKRNEDAIQKQTQVNTLIEKYTGLLRTVEAKSAQLSQKELVLIAKEAALNDRLTKLETLKAEI